MYVNVVNLYMCFSSTEDTVCWPSSAQCRVEITSGRSKDPRNVWSVQEHSLASSLIKRLQTEVPEGPETAQAARSPTTQ